VWVTIVPRPSVPYYSLHQHLWGYFPAVGDGEPRPFLYRAADRDILILSRLKPSCPALPVADRIRAGRVYQFSALVSPMNGHKLAHKPGRGRLVIEGNEARRAWLGRRMEGAELTFCQIFDRPNLVFRRAGGERIWIAQCEAHGTLRVMDRAMFLDSMIRGIGGRGCWGFGLLVLPEVMGDVLRRAA
jgi:CRISPR-associated protein Cas6/Cse3/CasE subtype I-E